MSNSQIDDKYSTCPVIELPAPPPMFVAMEGVPGSGKTTVQARVAKLLTEATSRETQQYADPSSNGRPIAKVVQDLREKKTNQCSPLEMGLLYTASRLGLSTDIAGVLRDGRNAVVDRWSLSTVVFQGCDRQMAVKLAGIQMLLNILQPDLWIVLDLPYFIFQDRRTQREASNGCARHVDEITESRYDLLRRRYYEVCGFDFDKDDPEPMLWSPDKGVAIISGTLPIDKVCECCKDAIGRSIRRTKSVATAENHG